MPDQTINSSIVDYLEAMSMNTEDTLRSIHLTLKQIAREDGLILSQSSLKDLAIQEQSSRNNRSADNTNTNRDNRPNRNASGRGRDSSLGLDDLDRRKIKQSVGRLSDDIEKGFSSAFKEALFGSANPIQSALREPISQFADKLGVDIKDLGTEVGRRLGKQVGEAFKNNPFGQRLQAEWQGISDSLTSSLTNMLNSAGDWLSDPNSLSNVVNNSNLSNTVTGGLNDLADHIQNIVSRGNNAANADQIVNSGSAVAESAEGLSAVINAVSGEGAGLGEAAETLTSAASSSSTALAVVGESAGAMGPAVSGAASSVAEMAIAFPAATAAVVVAAVAAAIVIDKLSEAIGPAIEGFKSFGKAASAAANRQTTEMAKNREAQQARIKADVETMTKAAFDVIEDAAKKAEQVWDNVLTTVSATQGYDKAGVQDLWSSYAARLKEDNLTSVVSSADIMEKLESVLKSGLSGVVAEEFAYQATLLNNAIPTEDFFQYASTYASIAANAIKNGASQQEAIAAANSELAAFANNLLYASREIAGGFTTSLQGASSLFESATKIAMTSRTGDVSDISGVLTSVSAIVGSIAPDLADTLVTSVVNAAIGGNSSEITALRSMAGVGASNTVFLQEFANDPQKIFANLFNHLAELQNMSADNYMEVAEGLSSVFGLSMDAFARVDFEYLAEAISAMNVNSNSLEENLELLASGQTTSTESQLRMQKINEYMIDQGLAYVLDNEVARSIQEHMWQEQIARELTESMFAVDLQGGALDLINGLVTTVIKIADVINPVAWVKKAANLALTAVEGATQSSDIKKILEATVVGEGNDLSLKQLTTTGRNLRLTGSYASMLDVTTASDTISKLISLNNILGSPLSANLGNIANSASLAWSEHNTTSASAQQAGVAAAKSAYNYAVISKSTASAIKSLARNTESTSTEYDEEDEIVTRSQEDAKNLADKITESIKNYTKKMSEQATSINNVNAKLLEDSKNSLIARDAEVLKELGEIEHRSFYTDAEISAQVAKEMAKMEEENAGSSFEDWLEKFQSAVGIKDLDQELSYYGESLEAIRSVYESEEASSSAAATKARQLHEVQFWEDMQNFATKDFPWYMREWERYYIQHEAYNEATGGATGKGAYEAAVELKAQEQGEFGDSVFALAKALTENQNWQQELGDKLKEPAVQTNALLAQILLLVDAIRQQNNDTSIVSVPTALSSLGLGVTNK